MIDGTAQKKLGNELRRLFPAEQELPERLRDLIAQLAAIEAPTSAQNDPLPEQVRLIAAE